MKFEEYRQYDALGLATLVKNKEVKATELLEIAIARVEEVNPQLNAIVHKLYDYGKHMLQEVPEDSIFQGVPFLVKDLGIQIKDTPMNVGSRFLKKFVSKEDSFVIQQLRKAGLVFFGKTNTPEFGLTPYTEPLLYGPCVNPWNLNHSSGGSSGGSASAVAGGIVPMATASDGGGSIRIPASCCGLFGFKASRGHSSFRPHIIEPWAGFISEGCNSRSVRDTAAYLDVIAGKDIGEFYLTNPPKQSFIEALNEGVESLKIGFSVEHTLGMKVDEECKNAVRHTAKLLEDLGHQVEEVSLPYRREDLTEIFIKIVAGETYGDLASWAKVVGRKLKRSEIEPNTWAMRLLGETFTAGDYALARQNLGELCFRMGQWHQQYDILLTPTLAYEPIKNGALQNSKTEARLVEMVNRLNLKGMLKANLKQFVDKAFGYIPFTPLANMTGQPSMSVPLYWSQNNLPIGSMFTAKIGADALLFRLAKQLEEADSWFEKVPDLVTSGL